MKIVAMVLVLTTLIGCGTIETLTGAHILDRGGEPEFGPFSGVQRDVHVGLHGHILPILGWFDLPFSLVFDIVLLPFSIPVALLRE